MIAEEKKNFTKYEIARIIGARALQLSMNAPVLIKIEKEKMDELKHDVLKLAEIELEEGVLPISVKRPMPKKVEGEIKKEEPEKEEEKIDEKIEKEEEKEEKEIVESGEIMELAEPEEEAEEIEGEENAEET